MSKNADERWELHQGESYAWLRSISDASVDGVITDPPYSSGGAFRGDRMASTGAKYQQSGVVERYADFTGDNRDQRAFATWATLWLLECWRIARDGAPVVLFTDWRQLPTMTDALQAGGFVWRGVGVWDKTSACRPSKGRFAAQAEYFVWGSKGAMPVERDVGCLPGVVTHRARRDDRHHQTSKPTPLMAEVVKIVRPGGVILDPFSGSGTTGVAALLSGYRFAGCELSTHYHGVASRRLRAAARGVQIGKADAAPNAQQRRLW